MSSSVLGTKVCGYETVAAKDILSDFFVKSKVEGETRGKGQGVKELMVPSLSSERAKGRHPPLLSS